jgi:hypothetical protein
MIHPPKQDESQISTQGNPSRFRFCAGRFSDKGAGRQKPHGTEQARNVNVSTVVSKIERKAKYHDARH